MGRNGAGSGGLEELREWGRRCGVDIVAVLDDVWLVMMSGW